MKYSSYVLVVTIIVAVGAGLYWVASKFRPAPKTSVYFLTVERTDVSDVFAARLSEDLVKEVSQIEGVDAVCPSLMGRLVDAAQGQIIVVAGIPADGFLLDDFRIIEGHRLSASSSENNEIMLGAMLADRFHLAVGSSWELKKGKFTVVGTFRGGNDGQNRMAIVRLDAAQKLLNAPKAISGCVARLNAATPEESKRIERQIENEVAERVGLAGKLLVTIDRRDPGP